MEEERRHRPLTVRGGIWAVLAAALLAYMLYYVIGFPANIPVALGGAVVMAELVEGGMAGRTVSSRLVLRSVVHGVLAAAAGWLGVVVVRAFGGMG